MYRFYDLQRLSISSWVISLVRLNSLNCLFSLTCNNVVRSPSLYFSLSGIIFTGSSLLNSNESTLETSVFVKLLRYQIFFPIIDLGSLTKTLLRNLISLLGEFSNFFKNLGYKLDFSSSFFHRQSNFQPNKYVFLVIPSMHV